MYTNNKDFYPTPVKLIDKMLSKVKLSGIKNVLEPSAGKGNIIEELEKKGHKYTVNVGGREYSNNLTFNVDCIEIDPDLQAILRAKKYKVIHDDFLTYQGLKQYDLIIANFPFSKGDKHLLKALELIEYGGQLVCLINANTLKNPFSNTRKDLLRKLKEVNAKVEFLQEEFTEAERKTNVETALIYVNIPKKDRESIIINKLKQEEQFKQKESNYTDSVVVGDFLEGLVSRYNFEVKAGADLINEYQNLKPLLSKSKDHCILNLELNKYIDNYNKKDLLENFICAIRNKYWTMLFDNPIFTKMLTTNLLDDLRRKITELQDYDFSMFNINEIKHQLNGKLVKGVEDTILKLFDDFSYKSYFDESSNNIHYFNGWKTNSCYKINKKVVIRLNAYGEYSNRLFGYQCRERINDIERVFNYLDDCKTEDIDLEEVLDKAAKDYQTKKIETKYFFIDVYKKGTTHLTFKNDDLLKKFNIFGSEHKGWLPPFYGKKPYSKMNKEEKTVVDQFEGEKEYSKTVADSKYYLYNPNNALMLGE